MNPFARRLHSPASLQALFLLPRIHLLYLHCSHCLPGPYGSPPPTPQAGESYSSQKGPSPKRPAKPPSSTKPQPLKQGYLDVNLDCNPPSLPQLLGVALLAGSFPGGKVKSTLFSGPHSVGARSLGLRSPDLVHGLCLGLEAAESALATLS